MGTERDGEWCPLCQYLVMFVQFLMEYLKSLLVLNYVLLNKQVLMAYLAMSQWSPKTECYGACYSRLSSSHVCYSNPIYCHCMILKHVYVIAHIFNKVFALK